MVGGESLGLFQMIVSYPSVELGAKQQEGRKLPEDAGKFSKAMDTALPGKHTRELYDKLKRRAASVLAQLRTGMSRLSGFLGRIGAAESDQYACGHARETVEHFLLRCVR